MIKGQFTDWKMNNIFLSTAYTIINDTNLSDSGKFSKILVAVANLIMLSFECKPGEMATNAISL